MFEGGGEAGRGGETNLWPLRPRKDAFTGRTTGMLCPDGGSLISQEGVW